MKVKGLAMRIEKEIHSLHLDLLKEIGNIGAGHAASALSVLLDKKIDMNVPSVRMIGFDEMLALAGGEDTVVLSVFLRIEGEITGSMFFILPLEQATQYVQSLTKDDTFSFEQPPYSELGLSAMQELGNILTGAYLSSLSDFAKISVAPSVPAISIDYAGAILSYWLIEVSQNEDGVIVIDTKIADQIGKQTVQGHFFLLPDPPSFTTLFEKLGVPMND